MHGMHSLTLDTEIKKDQLLEILRTNRTRHAAMFKEAIEGYNVTARERLTAEIKKLEDGKIRSISLRLEAPTDHTKDYDTVIGMFEKDVRDTVKLSAPEYRMLVEDEWDWMNSWLVSNLAYSSSTREYATIRGISGTHD
jgi:hypothetical protein